MCGLVPSRAHTFTNKPPKVNNWYFTSDLEIFYIELHMHILIITDY
jgi:hypothetical protein